MALVTTINKVELRFPTVTGGTLVDGAGEIEAFITYTETTDGVSARKVTRLTHTPVSTDPPHSFVADAYTASTGYPIPP